MKSKLLTVFALFFFFDFATPKTLNFTSEGTFKILQITDLHYEGNDYTGNGNMKIQSELIKRVKPDVVVVTGDVLSGYMYHGQAQFVEDIWEKFATSFHETDTYYAYIMGNHDADEKNDNITPERIFKAEMASKYSLLAASQNHSFENFNYYLPVYSNLKPENVSTMLWLFDSHSEGCSEEGRSWGCVERSQNEWYEEKAKELQAQNGKDVHHLGFVHIPPPEYVTLYNDHEYYGDRLEDVSCPLVNTGFIDLLKKIGEITAVFVGHDHLNDYGGWIDGIELVYGRKTGYGGYGQEGGRQRGARVIELKEKLNEDGSLKVERNHYIVLEDPSKEQELSKQKEVKKREGLRQKMCLHAGRKESIFEAILWVFITVGIIRAFGLYWDKKINRQIKQVDVDIQMVSVKKELRSPGKDDDDESGLVDDLAI